MARIHWELLPLILCCVLRHFRLAIKGGNRPPLTSHHRVVPGYFLRIAVGKFISTNYGNSLMELLKKLPPLAGKFKGCYIGCE